MTLPNLDKSLLYLLLDVYAVGADLPAPRDALAVVRAVRKVRPLAPQLAVAEAMQLANDGDRAAARAVLDEADACSPGNAAVKATLALVLIGMNDSLWQAYVDEVKALPPDAQALALVASIERTARNEPADLSEPADAVDTTWLITAYRPHLQKAIPC